MSKVVIHPLTELADWIDTSVIAEAILEELEDQGVPPTLENGQEVWLDALEEIHHLVSSSVVGLITRGKLRSDRAS